jgi:hypothetical protein
MPRTHAPTHPSASTSGPAASSTPGELSRLQVREGIELGAGAQARRTRRKRLRFHRNRL